MCGNIRTDIRKMGVDVFREYVWLWMRASGGLL
jgi:hypothetical protein